MNLALDFGNSFVKIGLFEGDQLYTTKRFQSNDHEALIECLSDFSIDHAILASVVNIPDDLRKQLKNRTPLLELTAETPLPINIAYETPETLGIDRLAAASRAWSTFLSQPTLAIDTGTCITYDLVTADGTYQGGAISPGIGMRFKALHHFTHLLPLIAVENEQKMELTGRNTRESICSGTLNGIFFEVDGFISAYREVYQNLTVLVGGGDTAFFEKNLKNRIFAEPNMVLHGLNEILKFNVSH